VDYALDCVLTLSKRGEHEVVCTPASGSTAPRTSVKIFDGNPAVGDVLVEVRGPQEKLRELGVEVIRGEGPLLSEILEPIEALGKVTAVSPPVMWPRGEAQLAIEFSGENPLSGYPLVVRRHEGSS